MRPVVFLVYYYYKDIGTYTKSFSKYFLSNLQCYQAAGCAIKKVLGSSKWCLHYEHYDNKQFAPYHTF